MDQDGEENLPELNKQDIENLKEWQKRQNGSIQRIEKKIDKVLLAIIIAILGTILNLFQDSLQELIQALGGIIA